MAAAKSAAAGLGQDADLRVSAAVHDSSGSHLRFDRTYQGLEVVGGDFVVHQDENGAVRSTSGGVRGLSLATTPAAAVAAKTKGTLVVFVTDAGTPRLAYKVTASGRKANGEPTGSETYVDARNGKKLSSWSTVETADGTGTGVIDGTVPLSTTQTGPTANGVTGITRAKAEKVWYRTLTTYLTSRSDYAAARTGSIQAATDLYGAGSVEATAVANAWTAVNVL